MSGVRDYHARTRWTPDRPPAAEPLDPATEPAAFRRYKGAELLPLDSREAPGPAWRDLFRPGAVAPRPLDRGFISRLFFESLAISAWKQEGPLRFSLRVNPSAGNLHPVEAYLLAGPVEGLSARPALYHYSPFDHGLEIRRELPNLPGEGVLVGLTAILWRTVWKYGERGFRLAHLDAGHALAAVAMAAAAQGWRARFVDVGDEELARWLGVEEQTGLAAERPAGLLALEPGGGGLPMEIGDSPLTGQPTKVSRGCREVPRLEAVAEATLRAAGASFVGRSHPIPALLRGRRSRPDFAEVPLSADLFRHLLNRLTASVDHPIWPFPAAPALRLAFFVHRIEGVRPGLYGLESSTLRLLLPGDLRALAQRIACGQTAAGQAAFVAVFLADLTPTYEPGTGWLYKRLHWQAGALSHLLYLEAEATGLGATGLAGFYDGAVPDLLGPWGRGLEALYLTAVGVRRPE